MDIMGLILNFIGALLVAISIHENPEGAYQDYKFFCWNIKLKLASINMYYFWGGIFVLCAGFVFQIISKLI
jgi:hypothetical protein